MNKYESIREKLKDEYLETFDGVVLYYDLNNIADEVIVSCIEEIGDLLLSAQNSEKPVHNVVGNNISKFCNHLRDAYMPHWIMSKILFNIIIIFICTISAGITPYLIDKIMGNEISFTQVPLNDILVACILAIVISDVFINIIRVLAFSTAKKNQNILKAIKFINKYLFFVLIVVFMILIEDITFVLTLGQILVMLGITIVAKIITDRIFVFKSKTDSSSLLSLSEYEEILLKQARKEYHKINEKRSKKGKAPLSQQDMVIKLKKENKILYSPFTFIIVISAFFICIWSSMEYNILILSLIFGVLLFLLLILQTVLLMTKGYSYQVIKKLDNEEELL